MKQFHDDVKVTTSGPGLYLITDQIALSLINSGIESGLLTLLIQHTSASITIQENADPDVQLDLADFMENIVPRGPANYRHTAEGNDDMPAHIKSTLTHTSLSIPIVNGKLRLGTWQGIYLFEHRDRPHNRTIAVHVMGA